MKKYKVLWFDDEHEDFQSIKDEAFLEDVQLIGYTNAQEGIPELLKNHKEYDAVLLDGLFFKIPDHKGTDIDQNAFGQVAKALSDLKATGIIIPWFIFSGQKIFLKDKNDVLEIFRDSSFANGKVFDKSIDTDFTELLNEIKKAADSNPERKIKINHAEIFSIFEEGILPDEIETQLLAVFQKHHYTNKAELKAILTNIRSIQESIFIKLEGIGVLQSGLSFNHKNTHLSGNKNHASGYKPTSIEYQTTEIENLQKWIYITCGTYIHHLEKEHYNGHIISNYAVNSMFSGLLELLLWFKKTYKENI
jgi:hypothetical protein